MLVRCTRDLKYRFVSRAYAELIGVSAGALVGKPLVDVIGQEVLNVIRPSIDQVLRGERADAEGDRRITASGKEAVLVVEDNENVRLVAVALVAAASP